MDPSGWQYFVDPSSGAAYWYNHLTAEFMWDSGAASSGLSQTPRASDFWDSWQHQVEVTTPYYASFTEPPSFSAQDYAVAQSTYVPSATDQWETHYDEATGAYYYYNTFTGESEWADAAQVELSFSDPNQYSDYSYYYEQPTQYYEGYYDDTGYSMVEEGATSHDFSSHGSPASTPSSAPKPTKEAKEEEVRDASTSASISRVVGELGEEEEKMRRHLQVWEAFFENALTYNANRPPNPRPAVARRVSAANSSPSTLLVQGVLNGLATQVFEALENGASVAEYRDQLGNNLFHLAASGCRRSVLAALLEAPDVDLAMLDQRNQQGWTPLLLAIRAGGAGEKSAAEVEGTVKFLCECAADPNVGRTVVTAGGDTAENVTTPLHEAVRWCSSNVCGLLLRYGASLSVRDFSSRTASDLANAMFEKAMKYREKHRGASSRKSQGDFDPERLMKIKKVLAQALRSRGSQGSAEAKEEAKEGAKQGSSSKALQVQAQVASKGAKEVETAKPQAFHYSTSSIVGNEQHSKACVMM